MELVAHMRSASETRAEPGDLSRENDFAAASKTSMMAFPVAVTKGWTFVLQYPTESVGFLGSFWMSEVLMRYQTLTVAAGAVILTCVMTPAVAQTRLLNVS